MFLNIAKEAELEEARNSGNAKPVEYVLPDGTTLSVSAVGSKGRMRVGGADWKGEGGEGGNAKP